VQQEGFFGDLATAGKNIGGALVDKYTGKTDLAIATAQMQQQQAQLAAQQQQFAMLSKIALGAGALFVVWMVVKTPRRTA
jgi:hypothetical protein